MHPTGKTPFAGPVCRLTERQVRLSGEVARVMIVDDDEANVRAFAALLEIEGFEIRSARDGIEAVTRIGPWVPHLIVLDIKLAGYDGFKVASIIRNMRSTREVGIVAATGYSDAELRTMGLVSHFDAVFRKGGDGAELVSLARSILI
jgi:CheY-like chemotaxis protein